MLPKVLQRHWYNKKSADLVYTIKFVAEEEGFEPTRDLHLLSVFETDPFNHLGIPP